MTVDAHIHMECLIPQSCVITLTAVKIKSEAAVLYQPWRPILVRNGVKWTQPGSINGATLNRVVEWKILKKSLRTKERWENVLQSCHPFAIQLYRALESAVQIALKEVALVFGGFSCLCRKERKEGRGRELEAFWEAPSKTEPHKGRNFQYKLQITVAPSQTLALTPGEQTTISTSVQVMF